MVDKQLERWYLNRFASTCIEFPQGKLVSGEKPDFSIIAPNKVVGIELTRLYVQPNVKERPRQEQESLRARILEEAGRSFASRDSRLVHVNVLFSLDSNLHKEDIKRLGKTIASLVSNTHVEEGSFQEVESDLPHDVSSIVIVRSTKLTNSYWHADDVGFIPIAGIENVQEILSRKERKLQEYLSKVDSSWLVIVVDGSGLSSQADWPEVALDHIYESSYDRVYIFFNAHNESRQMSSRPLCANRELRNHGVQSLQHHRIRGDCARPVHRER